MKLILHIGTEKTGTTSFQQWAAANRDGLDAQGVFHSRVLGRINHIGVYLYALPPETDDEGFFQFGLSTLADRKTFQADLPGRLEAEVKQARDRGCHTFLISNEHCHSRLRTAEAVARLRDLLAANFDDIKVMCSLRPQIDVAVSLTSTVSRTFNRVDREWFQKVTAQDHYYDYDALEHLWRDVFGPQALEFFAFRRSPDMVALLAKRLGLDMTRLSPAQRFNEALDVRTMALANALVANRRKQGSGIDPFVRVPLDRLACEETLQIGMELAQQVQARFAKGNAAVAARTPGLQAADLDPDWRRYEAASNLHILESDCSFSAQLAEMVRIMNAQSAASRLREKMAETERAVANGNLAKAQGFLSEAKAILTRLPLDLLHHPKEIKRRLATIEERLRRRQKA